MSAPSSAIQSVLVENRVFHPSEAVVKAARISGMGGYNALCAAAEKDFEGFWARLARENVVWNKPFTRTLDESNAPFYKWFDDGELNASANCLDKHMGTLVENKTAIIFEADDGAVTKLTYKELLARVSQFANALKASGVQKGDRVLIYMPMTVEGVVAMQACARIGATHSVVFGGFSAKALQERIIDAGAVAVITANYQLRGGRELPLKAIVDEGIAMGGCESIRNVFVYQRTATACAMVAGRDKTFTEVLAGRSTECAPVAVGAEHPLFILYTSGTTGKPKGILHTTGGYLTQTSFTHRAVFDLKPDSDVYWCTADIGWVTGHSYIVYGPLANRVTQVIYEGTPDTPDKDRFWDIVERHRVSILYTAPTAIRTFMKWGDAYPLGHDLSSLRLLGSVGEPINPEAWMWYRTVIGGSRCPIVDTWWQTETGAIMISPLPGVTATKPGSAMGPLPGIGAAIVDDYATPVGNGHGGYLVLTEPWPAMLRGIWGDSDRYVDTYWSRWPQYYFAGDGAKWDEDGAIWLLGRVDDVMNISGHRISTTEVESALVSHPKVAEAAVVGAADETTGQGIVAFVILRGGVPTAEAEGTAIITELRNHVAHEIGPIAKPRQIMVVPELPKTRSGKIMRRLLRDVAENRVLGDATTLADPAVMGLISSGLAAASSDD